jgi:hypothetical protein
MDELKMLDYQRKLTQADEKNGKYLEVTPKKKEPAEPRRAAPRWN